MKTECCLIRDLLPLYAEDIVSEETAEIVKAHLEDCPECKEELSLFGEQEKVCEHLLLPQTQDEIKPFRKILKKTNRQFNILCYAVIILLLFIGVSFSDWGETMLKSIAVMPAVGALGYVLFRYKALYKLPLMLLLTEIIAFIIGFIERDFYMIGINAGIACVFILAGFLIAMLLHFAFGKEHKMKKKILKITSFCVAFALLSGICFFTNGIVGNPISRFIAEKNINEYIEKNYAGQGYEVTNIRFDYLGYCYRASVSVPDSPDRHFGVSAGLDGKVKGDGYKDRVLSNMNTAERINSEYVEAVDEVFKNPAFQYPKDASSCYGRIEFAENVGFYDELEPDMLYNLDEFGTRAGHIYLEIRENNLTAENAARIMLHAKTLLDESGIEFNLMDCTIRNPDTEDYEVFSVDNFPGSEIYEDGMVERVKLAGTGSQ